MHDLGAYCTDVQGATASQLMNCCMSVKPGASLAPLFLLLHEGSNLMILGGGLSIFDSLVSSVESHSEDSALVMQEQGQSCLLPESQPIDTEERLCDR